MRTMTMIVENLVQPAGGDYSPTTPPTCHRYCSPTPTLTPSKPQHSSSPPPHTTPPATTSPTTRPTPTATASIHQPPTLPKTSGPHPGAYVGVAVILLLFGVLALAIGARRRGLRNARHTS